MVSVGSITGRDKAKNMTFLFVASTLSTYHLGMRTKTGCLLVSIMYLSFSDMSSWRLMSKCGLKTGATNGAGTAYRSGILEFTSGI